MPGVEKELSEDDVLAILKAHLSLERSLGNSLASVDLTRETTLADWVEAAGLTDAAASVLLAELFALSATESVWKNLSMSGKQHTLRDLCAFVAVRATVPSISDATFLGRDCGPARVFLTLRESLRKSCVNVERLAPSSLLAPWLAGDIGKHFLLSAIRVYPRSFPSLKVSIPLFEHIAVIGILIASVACGLWTVGKILGYSQGWMLALLLALLGGSCLLLRLARLLPVVTIPGAATVGDLCIEIARRGSN